MSRAKEAWGCHLMVFRFHPAFRCRLHGPWRPFSCCCCGYCRPYSLSARHLLLLCLCLALLGDGLALAWLHVMLSHAESVVTLVLWGAALASTGLCFTFLLLGMFNAFVAFAVLSVRCKAPAPGHFLPSYCAAVP
jgi:hypothetical protein